MEMIKRAKSLSLKNAHFFCSGSVPAGLYGNAYCFSSVLHEVYSYNSPEYIDLFWKNLQNAAPEYIIIRDMATTCQNDRPRSNDLDIHKIQKKADAAMLAEFESKYGSIDIQKNLVHFLLKHRYVENWERELQEDYFAVSVKEISSRLGNHYDIVYQEEYVLPFIHDTVMEDFGIDLRTNTHMKLILKEIR